MVHWPPPYGDGAAIYEGGASGVYSRRTGATEATRRNDFFKATATLTVDFSLTPELVHSVNEHGHTLGGRAPAGFAAGRIHDIRLNGERIAGNPEITLGRTRFSHHGGTYDGRTSMTFASAD